MTSEIQDKLSKVYELVNRGATEGEKVAAQRALERLVKKYNITAESLNNIEYKKYYFKYSTSLELKLFLRLIGYFLPEYGKDVYKKTWKVREVAAMLKYEQFITIECAYEYFRKHMKAQWNKVCASELKRCRKAKTRNKRREQLQDAFFSQYVIASKLYKDGELKRIDINQLSQTELADLKSVSGVEGGIYNKQVTNGLLLGQCEG